MNSNKDEKKVDLNDVLNFIKKANRQQKRAIDLALAQKNEYNFEVTFKRGKRTIEEIWSVDSPVQFIDVLISNGKMPISYTMERRMRYAS